MTLTHCTTQFMSRKLGCGLLLFLLFTAGNSFAQVGTLMYDTLPVHIPDTIPVFHDYNRHAFFGYDDCTRYIELKYGFVHEYHGQLRRISYRIMCYDWLNRQWSKQMRQRNGPNWVNAYYKDLQDSREESIFQDSAGTLSDSAFAQIKNITFKEQLLRIPPLDILRYLTTTSIHSGANSELLEMRRDVKFLVTAKDNWVKKADITKLIQYIYASENYGGSIQIRRACLCPDTVVSGQPTRVGLEAFKLIGLYRGFDYPTSFPSVSKAEVDELFRWWMEERKRP